MISKFIYLVYRRYLSYFCVFVPLSVLFREWWYCLDIFFRGEERASFIEFFGSNIKSVEKIYTFFLFEGRGKFWSLKPL